MPRRPATDAQRKGLMADEWATKCDKAKLRKIKEERAKDDRLVDAVCANRDSIGSYFDDSLSRCVGHRRLDGSKVGQALDFEASPDSLADRSP